MKIKYLIGIFIVLFLGCSINILGFSATGGTTYFNGTHIVHIFTSNDTFTVSEGGLVEVLVIAGGGGGGGYVQGGGGGAGGVVYNLTYNFTSGVYPVKIGSGGIGGNNGSSASSTSGANSSIGNIMARGGGFGGTGGSTMPVAQGGDGGSSGGGGGTGAGDGLNGTASQPNIYGTGYGYSGGLAKQSANFPAGGGGGAGGLGGSPATGSSPGGSGGIGRNFSITGTNICYAGGGAGSGVSTYGNSTCGGGNFTNKNATLNTGGGGAGNNGTTNIGGNGGSGIIIIRYESNGYVGFSAPSENNITKYLPLNYIMVNVSANITNYQNMTIYLYNSTGLYTSYTTTNATQFLNFTVPMTNDTYYYNVTARNTTGDALYSSTYTNYIQYATLNATLYNYTGGIINTFNITINDTNYGTATGYINIPVIIGYTYNIQWKAIGYAYNYTNITINTSYTTINSTVYPSNSLNITIYSELTNTLINNTFNTQFIGIYNQFNQTITNGNKFITQIPEDIYTITITNINYSTRTYVVTITNTTTSILNAYMINGTNNIGIYTYNYANEPLISTINIQRLFNTSYVTIAQGLTDATGYTSLSLVDGTIYKITITSDGYGTRTSSFTPYYANQPYTFKLESESIIPFISPLTYISYNILPVSTQLTHNNYTFSFQLSSIYGLIESQNISCNGITDHITGSPNGATNTITLDLTTYSGIVRCQYYYNLDGYDPISINRTYYVASYNITNNHTAISGITDFMNENDNDAWNIVVGMFLVLVVVVLLSQITGTGIVATIGALTITLILGIVGMFPISITLFVLIIGIIWLYFGNQGY